MFGWSRRCFFLPPPFFLPTGISVANMPPASKLKQRGVLLLCILTTFCLAAGLRLLEQPYWENPAYTLANEYLLATHDAYHWIAGAEGFEFGAGHPMSELVRILAAMLHTPPANVGFWFPPFMGGVLAVAIFIWGWGLGYPFGGICAGVIASLSPGFFARTLLGYYDTDLVVLLFAVLLGLVPALWLTPWLASVPDVLLGIFHRRKMRTSAGCSVQTGASRPEESFSELQHEAVDKELAPTSREEYLTKTVWRFGTAQSPIGQLCMTTKEMQQAMLPWSTLLLLMGAGFFGYTMQSWHSLFPYLVRFSALVMPMLIWLFGPRGGRRILLRGSACHALPLLLGLPGAGIALIYAVFLTLPEEESAPCRLQAKASTTEPLREKQEGPVMPAAAQSIREVCRKLWTAFIIHPLAQQMRCLVWNRYSVYLVWGGILFLCADADVFRNMLNSFSAYVSRGGDMATQSAVMDDPIIFPSVSQSIIEVQTINLSDLFIYFYPNEQFTALCFLALAYRVIVTPAFIWFIPLVALSFLSLKMGGRMTMFGAPALLLAFCMACGFWFEQIYCHLLYGIRRFFRPAASAAYTIWTSFTVQRGLASSLLCLLIATGSTLMLAWPVIALIPDYTQGPIISREHAEALRYIQYNTPQNSVVWNWWDWGYATHHFSHRPTIADGARHGGPSLFLPAAVYTTADARFARQLIKYTALKGNDPGDVFEGLSAAGAQQLMVELGDKNKPLIESTKDKQYLVVSFELMRLGLWVTRYGSWNFIKKREAGALMSNITVALEYNLDTGEILAQASKPVPAASIDIFTPKNLIRNKYQRSSAAYHFVFNPQSVEEVALREDVRDMPLAKFWEWQRGEFNFTAPINDKMAMDDVFYNTLMVQLMLCGPDDPRFAPYFRLVYDNVYARVYEVL